MCYNLSDLAGLLIFIQHCIAHDNGSLMADELSHIWARAYTQERGSDKQVQREELTFWDCSKAAPTCPLSRKVNMYARNAEDAMNIGKSQGVGGNLWG